MIGFLKRWFATKSEVESVYSQLDTIAIAIQELRKDQQMRRDAELDSWRPEVTFNLKRTDDLKPRKLPAKPVVVEAPDRETLSRKIDEAVKRSDNYVETKVPLQYNIEGKMTALAGSAENFVKLCRKKQCHVLLSKATRLKIDDRHGNLKLREYPHGAIVLRNSNKKTANGNPVHRAYSFKTAAAYATAMQILNEMNCPYSTGRKQ